MSKYKKCPRCEVNYILNDEEYCEICQLEMKGKVLQEEIDEEGAEEICPRWREFLTEGEKYCEACQQK